MDELLISMIMTELPLGLSINLGTKAVPLAHLVKRIDERPISTMMFDSELPLGLFKDIRMKSTRD